jgi:hypothetical protein
MFIFSAKKYINGVYASTLAQSSTDTQPLQAYIPYAIANATVLNPNDMITLSITKHGAGQIVGAGNWQLVVKPI